LIGSGHDPEIYSNNRRQTRMATCRRGTLLELEALGEIYARFREKSLTGLAIWRFEKLFRTAPIDGV